MIPLIETRDGLSIFINGQMQEIPNTHPDFAEIRTLALGNEPDAADKIDDILFRALNAVTTAVAAAPQGSGVAIQNGTVTFNGEALHGSLVDRILRMVEEGFPVTPLVNFLTKLQGNPSFRVVNSLYDFLQVGGIPITEDGDFLAYKAIRSDWKDIHSGTMDNSIGKVLQIPRNKVDENANNTCSYGLHVCSWNYLPHFAHSNGRVVVVKVNPADVVAIPADYNNTKMRTARYEVISEYVDYYKDDPQNLLSSKSVFGPSFYDSSYEDDQDDEDDSYEDEDDNDDEGYYGRW